MAANLAHYFSFHTAQDVYGVVLMIFIVSYFLLCGNFSMFGSPYGFGGNNDEEVADLIRNRSDTINSNMNSPSSRASSRRVGKLVPKKK